ncbi:MAG: hypothetical protein FJZ58_06885 [Chlamydiae bacterium]|nr:hypothetical protein [Chlamydiota bacterium]
MLSLTTPSGVLRPLVPTENSREGRNILYLLKTNETFMQKVEELARKLIQDVESSLQTQHYRAFDALIRNDGCQITAWKVMQLMEKKENLSEEEKDQLVRFRLLALVNYNAVREGKEIPQTMISRVNDFATGVFSEKEMSSIKKWVTALQIDESKSAVAFIRQEVETLSNASVERAPLLIRALQEERMTTIRPIVSVSLFYNLETILRAASLSQKIVVLCNKLFLGGNRIVGAEKQECYMKLQIGEEEILSQDNVNSLEGDLPLLVIEAYVQTGISLENRVREYGLMAIMQAEAANIPQFASGSLQGPLQGEGLQEDIDSHGTKKFAIEGIEVDHIFCASMQELRGVS